MNIYHCWVTALLTSYQDPIVVGMVRKGYMIGPASKDGQVICATRSNAPSFLIALNVYKLVEDSEINAQKVYEDLMDVLKNMNAYYYSIIVSLGVDSIWSAANFDINIKKEEPPPPPADKKNVN
jgi:hypothetical protein